MDLKYLIIILGVGLLLVGIFIDYDFSAGSFDTKVKDIISGDSESRETDVTQKSSARGDITFERVDIETEKLEDVLISGGGGGGSVTVSGSEIKTEKDISVKSFDGTVTFNENISFDGVAEEVEVGDVIFENPAFSAVNIDPTNAQLSEITTGTFLLEVGEGSLVINERITIELENEVVEIVDFEGSLAFEDNNIVLDGVMKRVDVKGEYELSFQS